MRVSAWSHGRIADRRGIKRKQAVFSQAQVVQSGQLHDEVVGVLPVIDRLAERRLSLLEKQRIEALRYGCRFQAEHGSERKLAAPDLALRHGHKPVGGKHFVITAWAALPRGVQECIAVKHE